MVTAEITDQLLTDVLARYALASPRVLGPFESSKRNDNFLVEDEGGSRYILRRYRRNPSEPRILFQLRFQRELHRLGFPTSRVIEDNTGQLLVHNDAGAWVLCTFIDGAEYDFERPAQAEEAGRRLAGFHNASDGIDLEEVFVEHNPDVRRWWTHGPHEIARLDDLFAGSGADAEIDYLRAWQRRLVDEWPLERLDLLPKGWLHGDYHGRNMVFEGDEMRALFDFDVVYRGFRVEDIGLGLFMFSREGRGSTAIRHDFALRFLQGYESLRPLEDVEREALPMMAVLTWAPAAPYHEMLYREGEDSAVYFRRFVQLMRDIDDEMTRLARR
jgi:homoserine kinase type II